MSLILVVLLCCTFLAQRSCAGVTTLESVLSALTGANLSAASAGQLLRDATHPTAIFQQDLEKYDRVREFGISTQYADSWNYYNGMSYGTVPTQYHTIGGSIHISNTSDEFRGLLRFDNLTSRIPKGAVVSSATLILQVTTWTAVPVSLWGQYLTASWEFNQTKYPGGDQYKVTGWVYRGEAEKKWTARGALNDTHPGKYFSMQLLQVGSTIREAALDPDVVQSWLDDPSKNNGVILYTNKSGSVMSVTSITTPLSGVLRPFTPMLIVSYTATAANVSTPPHTAGLTGKAANRTIFVDAKNGNDNGNGHTLLPLKNLVVAVSIARSGDTILLRDGVYGGCQVSLPDITIMSAPGHWAVIAGPLYNPSQNVVIYIRDTAHRFRLANVEVVGGYYNAIATHTTWEYYPIGPQREVNGTAAENVVIEDCRLHSSGASVVKLGIALKNATLRRNLIHNAGRRSATYGHAVEAVNLRGAHIVDNYMFDVPGAGVKLSGGCKDVVVARNMIERAHLAGILLGFYEQTEYMDWITNPKWFECRRCKAVANIIYDIRGTGIGLYASDTSFVAHNTLYSVAHTMMSAIVLSSVQHWVNATSTGSPIVGNLNPRIVNNIVVKGKRSRPGNMLLQIRETGSYVDGSRYGALEPASSFNASHNVYHTLAEATPAAFVWGRGVMLEDERVATAFVGNLSMWQARWPGWEFGSVDIDPLLSKYFAPQPDCRAVRVPPAVTDSELFDFDGKPIVSAGDGLVFAGARQNATQDSVFPPLRSFAERRPPYNGAGEYLGSYIIWPYVEMEAHVPRTFVIAPWGTDSESTANATFSFPWRTASFAMQRMWPGDTLLLRGGQYTVPLRVYLPNITIASYPDEWAVINVSNSDTSVVNAVFFAGNDNGNFGGSGEVILRRLEIIGGYYYGVMFNQAGGGSSNSYWNWWKKMHGIVTPSVTIIEDCVIHNSGSHLIKLSPEANDIIFRRLKLYRSGKRGEVPAPPPANPAAGQANEESSPAAQRPADPVQGNGIDVRGSSRLVIEDCEFYDISGTAILLGGGAADCVLQRNLIYNVAGIGILVGSFNTEAMYMRLVENPKLYQAQRTIVKNNIVYNASGAGLGLYSTIGTVAAHNTFTNVASTMHASLLFNIAPVYESPSSELLPTNRDSVIVNNIFHQTVDARGYMLENRIWVASTTNIDPPTAPGTDTCAAVLAAESAAKNANGDAHQRVAKNSGIDGACPILPPDHPMNTRIDTYPIHPLSTEVMKRLQMPGCRCLGGDLKTCFTAGARNCGFLHPDFGGVNLAEDGRNVLSGFPITVVNQSTPKAQIPFSLYGDESDNVPYPFPADAAIENTPSGCPMDVCNGDRHVITFDTDNCMLYETWKTEYNGSTWKAANGAVFDLTTNALRPLGWTSADAAGLPIMPGLIRYDEVQRGVISHAIRVTFANTRKAYVRPATHYAAPENLLYLPAMGHRFRLRQSFNCSTLARTARIVCVALQTYGAIVADNGANWFLSGEAHPGWSVAEIEDVKKIPSNLMELVYTGEECITPDCRPLPTAPVFPTVSALTDLSTLYMNGNVYFKDAGDYRVSPLEFVDRDPQHFWRLVSGQLDGWKNHSQTDLGSIIGDPKLSNGFRLLNGSAALLSSPVLANFGVETDFFGRPRRVDTSSLRVDAGAISFVENDVVPVTREATLPRDPLRVFVDPCVNVTVSDVVYVATNGSDLSCSGSATAPLATLRSALRRVAENGVVLLLPGVHIGGAVVGRNGIRITSADPSRRAVLRSTFLAGGDALTVAGDGTVVEDLEIVGGYTATVAISGRFNTLRRCEVHGAGTAVVRIARSGTGTVVDSCVIRNSGQRIPRFGDGVLSLGASWLHIVNNTFRSIRSTAIHLKEGTGYVEVAYNAIFSATRGISVGNDNSNKAPLPDFDDYTPIIDNACDWARMDNLQCHAAIHVRVMSNIIHNTEGFGIGVAGTLNVTVVHNTLRRCANVDQAAFYLTALQLYQDAAHSPIITNNRTTIKNNIATIRHESYRPMWIIRRAVSWAQDATVVQGIDHSTAAVDGNAYFKEAPANTSAALPYAEIYYRRHFASMTNRTWVGFYDDAFSPPFAQFEQWRSRRSWDATSRVIDPLFEPSFPVALSAQSPLIGAAVAVSGADLVDAFGAALGVAAASDVGALQLTSTLKFQSSLYSRNVPQLLSTLFNASMSPPSSCIPSERPVAQCDGINCWHPWLSSPPPEALSMTKMLQTCLNEGRMFPAGHGMNRDLRNDRSHPLGDAYTTSIGASRMHPDWGTLYDGNPMGIPYMIVKGSKYPSSKLNFRYASESDAGPYVIPFNAPVEGGDCEVNGDRHILVLDAETCKLYEVFKSVYIDPEYHSWLHVNMSADSGVVFDMKSVQYRKLGFTSADAAGLSVFAGLVFKEEIDAGAIHHAIRYTVMKSQKAYIFPPATHFASASNRPDLPPMGLRARLKPWFNCTLPTPNRDFKTVCEAMKVYGLILADNGGNWFISGSSDSRWNDGLIQALSSIPVSALDIVDSGAKLCTSTDCT